MISPDKRSRPVPEGGLAEAQASGRHRRRVALGAGSGGVAAVAVVVALAVTLGGSSHQDSLQFADELTSVATSTPTATATATAMPRVTSDPTSSPSPAPESTETPDCINNDCDEQDDAVPPAVSAPATQLNSGPSEYRENPRPEISTTTCTGVGPGSDYTFCGGTSISDLEVRPGGRVTVTRRLCVTAASVNTLTLGFESGREQELTASRAGGLVWQFSRSVRYPQGAHQRTIDRQNCLVWNLGWDARDQSGQPAAPGDYTLTYQLTAKELNGERSTDDDLTAPVTFDVRVKG